MGHLQVLIADDSEFMRTAYKRILESESSMRVVAMASNGAEAVRSAAETAPDVAILDVRMPKVDGLQVAHEIRKHQPNTAIVVISAYDDLTYVANLMRNGVDRKAYLLKHSISDIAALVRIVEAVHQGDTVIDSGIVRRMAELFREHSAALEIHLSPGEEDLISLMAAGYDDGRICVTLHLDQMQMAKHSDSLYKKFGLTEGTFPELRTMAVKTFVGQLHKVPLSKTYDAVS
ncbi:MAG: response regulator transcription factor [Chloroflexi bacterium]|nr:response regulator transcription factor [Chloroflexota bacterium]